MEIKSADPIVKLYTKSIVFTFAALLLTSLIIGLFALLPFYHSLQRHNEEDFTRFGSTLQKQIQDHLDSFADVAVQVTSRTKARNTLIDYMGGNIPLHQARQIISDILSDVPRRSADVVGVMRFDSRGQLVASVGLALPDTFLDSLEFTSNQVATHTLVQDHAAPLFVFDAAIRDRDEQWVGNDIVVFRADAIEQTLHSHARSLAHSQVLLKHHASQPKNENQNESETEDAHVLFAAPDNADKKNGSKAGSEQLVHDYAFDACGLGLKVSMPKQQLHASAKRAMFRMSLFLLGLLLVGSAGIYLLGRGFIKKLNIEVSLRQAQQEELRNLLSALGEGVFGVDGQGRCNFINPAALRMLGFSEDEVLGQDPHDFFHQQHRNHKRSSEQVCAIYLTAQDGVTRSWEDRFTRKDGCELPVMLTATPKGHKTDSEGAVVVFRDITEEQKKEQQLRKEATTDPLTGVANRRLFLQQLDNELQRYKRFAGKTSMIMVDLDHFKQINDRYGHDIGDQVLQHFTALTQQSLRGTDLVGRLGGEEFAILLPVTDAEEALEFAERYRRLVADTPLQTDKGMIAYSISLGITTFYGNDDSPDKVLKRADMALYRAKESGRNRCESG